MYKVAVMGDQDSIYGFGLLGLDVYATDEEKEIPKLLKRLCKADYGIIYITEALASEFEDEINQYAAQSIPAIIPIPGVKGNTGICIKNVKKSVEQAVGSDIIFNS